MEIVRRTLKKVRLGAASAHANLAVYPLWTTSAIDRPYTTLDEALREGTARVTEVSKEGSVPELSVVNEGDRPVLLLDGEELRGAKQNRVLNLTILAPAGKTIVVPVSCVERGRWDLGATAFAGSDHVLYAALRSEKAAAVSGSLAREGRASSDQRAVWASIDAKLARLAQSSRTAAMVDAFEARRRGLDAFVVALKPLPGQTGAVFAMNGRVGGVELFDQASVLAAMFPKLVRSWALDAIETPSDDLPAPPGEAAQAFLDMVAEAGMQSFPAVGQGTDVRLNSAQVSGGALVDAGRVVHLNAFRVAEARAEPLRTLGGLAGDRSRQRESWIARASARLKTRKSA
jgi:hypothetical protein